MTTSPPLVPFSATSLERQLYDAATQDDDVAIKSLLAHHPEIDINQGDPEFFRTPLYRAAGHGCLKALRILLADPRINLSRVTNEGATPLIVAAQQGYVEIAQELLKREDVDVNARGRDGAFALFMAAQLGHVRLVKLLLRDPRTLVNQTRKDGLTALFMAAQLGHDKVVEQLLLRPDLEVNMGRADKITPLIIACDQNRVHVAKVLLRDPRVTGHLEGMKYALQKDRECVAEVIAAFRPLKQTELSELRPNPGLAPLINTLMENPTQTVRALRRKHGFKDDYLSLKDGEVPHPRSLSEYPELVDEAELQLHLLERRQADQRIRRFFSLTKDLPLELQTTVAGLWAGTLEEVTTSAHFEVALRAHLLHFGG